MRRSVVELALGVAVFGFGVGSLTGCTTAADAVPDAAGYVQDASTGTGGGSVECLTDSECTAALSPGVCQMASCESGACVLSDRATGSLCSDPSLTLDTCQTGRCEMVDAAVQCVASAAPDGQPCGASDACQAMLCSGGSCQTTEPKKCNDGNLCTDDACDPTVGCVYTHNTAPCDDGNVCTTDDQCADGFCSSGPNGCECFADSDCAGTDQDLCDDNVPRCLENKCELVPEGFTVVCPADGLTQCQINTCDPATGQCVTSANVNAACDDGNACTENDYCAQNGNCIPGSAVVCPTDGLGQCEQTQCAPETGCEVSFTVDAACDDGNGCTDGDVCSADGTCLAGPTITCEFNCGDNVNEDGDEETDCADSDCADSPACST